MLKKISLLFLIVAIAISACGTLEVSVEQTPAPELAQTQPAGMTLTPEPPQVATQPVTQQPVSDDDPPAPTFSDLAFFRTIKGAPGCVDRYQTVFPARIRQVYAGWNYANMRSGLTVRREWYRDGKPWFQRDEAWNFAKYGAKGTIKDISIYDFDAGLEPGDYELRLYINGQPQFDSHSKNDFLVDNVWSLETASPNGRLTAIIADPQRLIIREADGTQWERLRAHEISSVAWFPDSRHILYSDTDRSGSEGCTTIGIRYRVWIVDASTGDQYQIGSDDGNLHQPLLSPDGRFIVALTGSGWYDAGTVDLGLVFIELDDRLRPVHSFSLQDFAGIPAETSSGNVYPAVKNNDWDIGVWQDSTHFRIGLDWTGLTAGNPRGIYLFDLVTMQAAKTGALPQP